jgi:hypothetical protein
MSLSPVTESVHSLSRFLLMIHQPGRIHLLPRARDYFFIGMRSQQVSHWILVSRLRVNHEIRFLQLYMRYNISKTNSHYTTMFVTIHESTSSPSSDSYSPLLSRVTHHHPTDTTAMRMIAPIPLNVRTSQPHLYLSATNTVCGVSRLTERTS